MSAARTLSAFFAFAVAVVGVACSPFSGGACEENESCAAGDAGNSFALPPNCDLAKAAADAPACVSDEVAIFVSPWGSDDASGTKATPLKTIGSAVAVAASRRLPRVYVCDGTYDVPVEVKSAVSIFGGLTCTWQPSATARPRIAPPVGPALRVVKVTGPISFEDLDVSGGADANAPGASAIAAFVSESTAVTFRRVNLTAGAGSAGRKGEARSNYTAAATPGGSTSTSARGAGPTCTCVDGTSSKGGPGASGGGSGIGSGSSSPPVGSANAGTYSPRACTSGDPGANGNAAAPQGGAQSWGVLGALGWDSSSVASDANSGNGLPAQGGGGGGARTEINVGGGGGGCGGCGGAAGAPGTNGGSSFALLSFNSGVTIYGGSLATGAAGAGGAGGDGQHGQSGATYGSGSCSGGSGGSGAGGNGGAGGAGGHSVPIGFVGSEPSVTGATLIPWTAGAGGAGGLQGAGPGNAGSSGVPGPSGKSQSTLAL